MNANEPLNKVFFDNTSGSSAILTQVIAFIKDQAKEDEWVNKTAKTIEFGIRELKHFEVVRHFLESLKKDLRTFQSSKELIVWVNKYETHWSSIPDKWLEVLLGIIEGNKIVISSSSRRFGIAFRSLGIESN